MYIQIFHLFATKCPLHHTVLNDDGKFSLQWAGTLMPVERKGDCKVNTRFSHTTFNTHNSAMSTHSYLSPRLLPPILLPWPRPFVDSFSSHDPAYHHQTVTSVQSQCASVSPTVRQRRVHSLFACEPCEYENMRFFVSIMDWQEWEPKIVYGSRSQKRGHTNCIRTCSKNG